ncbi:TrmH family RNA methyltransferase [Nonomuraea salmonea]|uniref:TrmH family RNA methyltransferase n=1 Tax=Nonomuraea salmonea TaxID=46181 RepID=UPI003CD094A6
MSGIAGFQVHRGALASMERLPLPSVDTLLKGPARRILVLEDLVDHSNVGAIFRSAAALGVGAILLSPRCADPLYRRAVKVSMGAVFSIPYARMDDWFEGLTRLREAGYHTLALTPPTSTPPPHGPRPPHGPGGPAPRLGRRRPVLPLAPGGRRGGVHPDEPRRDGRRRRLPQRRGRRRNRLPRPHASDRPRTEPCLSSVLGSAGQDMRHLQPVTHGKGRHQ